MIVGLDFDGVVADCRDLKKEIIKRNLGIDVPAHICRKMVKETGWFPEARYEDVQYAIYNSWQGVFLAPIHDAIWYVHLLSKVHEVKVITSRGEFGAEIAQKWFRINGLDIDVIGTDHKPKTNFVSGFDVFVDDDPEKLLPLINYVEKLYLFSTPNNQDFYNPKIERVDNWKSLYIKINGG